MAVYFDHKLQSPTPGGHALCAWHSNFPVLAAAGQSTFGGSVNLYNEEVSQEGWGRVGTGGGVAGQSTSGGCVSLNTQVRPGWAGREGDWTGWAREGGHGECFGRLQEGAAEKKSWGGNQLDISVSARGQIFSFRSQGSDSL